MHTASRPSASTVRNSPSRSRAVQRTEVERSTDVVIDEWTYDLGRQKLIRLLTFVDGKLYRVETGGYGTRD